MQRAAVPAVLSVLSAVLHAQTAEFVPLGELSGGFYVSAAEDISADGGTVVGFSDSGSGFAWGEPFRWRPETGMEGIGWLGGGNDDGEAYGVSPDGEWIVGRSGSADGYQAFAWSETTGMFALGDLPGGEFRSEARAVSRNGRAVIGIGRVEVDGVNANEAFLWTPGDGMRGLGTLPTEGRTPQSYAYDISGDGAVVVGMSSTLTGGYEAFRWTEQQGMVGLGALDDRAFSSEATAVSISGRWSVGSSFAFDDVDDRFYTQAVIWDEAGDPQGLGWLIGDDPFGNFSIAADVSGDGRVVVGRAYAGWQRGQHAFVWTSWGGMRSIMDILRDDYGIDVEGDGWLLNTATAISADGSTIVGFGMNPDGYTEAWLVRLPIPEPGAPGLLVLAGAAARRRRR